MVIVHELPFCYDIDINIGHFSVGLVRIIFGPWLPLYGIGARVATLLYFARVATLWDGARVATLLYFARVATLLYFIVFFIVTL